MRPSTTLAILAPTLAGCDSGTNLRSRPRSITAECRLRWTAERWIGEEEPVAR